MGVVQNIRDRLTNVMSGMGTTADRSVWARYAFMPVDPQEAEAAYRSGGLFRKVVDIPPLDMTKAWREWQTEKDVIEKLEAEEKRHRLKAKCKRALILSRLHGGGALLLGTNDSDPMQPLNPASIKVGGLRYVRVMSRFQLTLGEQRLDPADPWVDKPEYFEINVGQGRPGLRLHPSRVVEFIGQPVPEGSYLRQGGLADSWFWGDPLMQSLGAAIKNADLAKTGFAGLIDRASVDVLKLKDLMSIVGTPEGETKITNRLAAANMGKSNYRALVLDTEDEWAQLQVTWAGIPEVIDKYLQIVSGESDIPVTRLLGQSPKGLQSTGDGEERDYQSMISARQDDQLTPALDRTDEVLIPSALGSHPSDIYYTYAPLQEENEKDASLIEKQAAETIKAYADSGLIPDVALSAMAKNRIVESGRWPGSEAAFEEAANEPLPSDEGNPADLLTREQKVALLAKQGTVTPTDAARLITDAQPRSLYVSRKLLNGAEFIKWAKGQGFATTVPADELHVTVLFSRAQVDWMKMGSGWDQDADGKLKVAAGGARLVEKLGDKGAVVLLFASSALSWRHEEMVRNGASHDFDEFQPHVTISYEGSDLDLSKVEPYRGELIFGPEIFAEVVDDWEQGLTEE